MLNQCNFIGRVCKEVDLKFTPAGVAVCSFSIAVNERYKDKQGNKVENVEFINVVIWRQLAEIAGKYLEKGRQVFISGKFTTHKWQDKNGNDRYTTEIVANQMQMLGNKDDGQRPQQQYQSAQPQQQQYQPQQNCESFDDLGDIPF